MENQRCPAGRGASVTGRVAVIPPILRMWCLESTPRLSLDTNGLCFGARLSTAGWTWNLIYLVVGLYV